MSEIAEMPKGRSQLVVAALVVVLTLAAFDQTVVSTALPVIALELRGHAHLSWVFSAYLIASTAVIPVYGKLADSHGRRAVLLVATAVFVAGSLLCGLSRDISDLLLSRVLQGLGGGGLLTLTMLAVTDVVAPRRIGQFQGMLGSAYGLAAIFGPPLGGLITEFLSWRWAFLLNVPTGILAFAVLAVAYRPRHLLRKEPVDFAGALLLAGGTVTLLMATRAGTGTGLLESPFEWPLIATACVAFFGAFVWTQMRVRHPILPLALFESCAFTAASALGFLTGVLLFTGVVFAPLYLQYVAGMSPASAGLQMLPLMLGVMVGSVVSGKQMGRHGEARFLALTGGLLSACAYCGVAWATRVGVLALLLPMLGILGIGIGTLIPVVTLTAQRAVNPRYFGIATATPIMFRTVGGALGLSLLGTVLSRGLRYAAQPISSAEDLAAAFTTAMQPVFWIAAFISLGSALVALGLPKKLLPPMHSNNPTEGNRSNEAAVKQ